MHENKISFTISLSLHINIKYIYIYILHFYKSSSSSFLFLNNCSFLTERKGKSLIVLPEIPSTGKQKQGALFNTGVRLFLVDM